MRRVAEEVRVVRGAVHLRVGFEFGCIVALEKEVPIFLVNLV